MKFKKGATREAAEEAAEKAARKTEEKSLLKTKISGVIMAGLATSIWNLKVAYDQANAEESPLGKELRILARMMLRGNFKHLTAAD